MKWWEIIQKLKWTFVDYDKAYWAQCVDFARAFCASNGKSIGGFWGSAINWWNSGSPFLGTRWVRVEYKPGLKPSVGDVLFWNRGKYGHVAIASTWSTDKRLIWHEQNWASWTGNMKKWDEVRRIVGDYTNVVWWYTYK